MPLSLAQCQIPNLRCLGRLQPILQKQQRAVALNETYT